MFGRPGESAADFTARCLAAANDLADKETAALRDKYADKVARRAIAAPGGRGSRRGPDDGARRSAQRGDPVDGRLDPRRAARWRVAAAAECSARSSAKPAAPPVGGRALRRPAIGSTQRTTRSEGLHQQLEDLEAELTQEVTAIDAKWMAAAKNVTTSPVSLERTDVKVTQLALVWIPVP